MVRFIVFALAAIWMTAGSPAFAAIKPTGPKPPKTPELLEKGRVVYFERCSFCHGIEGGGDGPVAEFLNPRPRNFKTNVFKFRSTSSGALPLDEDLFETISKGVLGTAMQSFDRETVKSGLNEEERWAVVYWIQTFSEIPDFSLWMLDEDYAKSDNADDKGEYRYNKVMKFGEASPTTPDLIAKGKEVYKTAKCFQCHGENGKGNGVSANGMKDDWQFPIVPRDLTKGWKYKGGTSVKEIFSRFTTGLNGTPMPSFASSIKEDDRWALAHFVNSLLFKPSEEQTLTVKKVEGELPAKADDAAWNGAGEIHMWLTGNVLIKPRWQNITVDMVRVKALFNDKEIAFRIEWNDRFANVLHEGTDDHHQLDKTTPKDKGNLQTYVPIYSDNYKPGRYRDAVMLQFPNKIPGGTEKPHFLNGDPSHAVNLWWWRADYDPVAKGMAETQLKSLADVAAAGATSGAAVKATRVDVADIKPGDKVGKDGLATVEMNAKGFKKAFNIQGKDSQAVASQASFNDGTWTVVMKRSLTTDDAKNDIQFEAGKFIPIAANAWDGWNKDIGMQKSISSWYFVYMEKAMPTSVYVKSIVAIIVIIGLQIFLAKKWREEKA